MPLFFSKEQLIFKFGCVSLYTYGNITEVGTTERNVPLFEREESGYQRKSLRSNDRSYYWNLRKKGGKF